jgi:hypothetical protein
MTKKATEHKEAKEARRESPSGYHYYSLYRDCPRKWALKYVYGLLPRFTAVPLIRGGIVHDATAVYYEQGWNLDAALDEVDRQFKERAGEFEDKGKIAEIHGDTRAMLTEWAHTFESDREHFELIEVEEPHDFYIGPNKDFLFTVRMDRVFYDKEIRTLIVRDTKTTGWSSGKTFHNAEQEDQMTAYLWAARKLWPKKATRIVELDVIYRRGKVTKKTEVERRGPIYRTAYDLARFELELYGLINEVTQKYLGLEHYPEPLLFPRSGRTCGLFGCEYESICRGKLKIGEVPIGFHRDPWIEPETRKTLTKVQESFNLELIAREVTA